MFLTPQKVIATPSIVVGPVAPPTIEQIISSEATKASVDHRVALAIAMAESGLNQKAYNPEWHKDRLGNPICQGSWGLFQIACVNYAGDPHDLWDPALNIEIAFKMQKKQGWRPWTTYVDGKYLKYMK